MDISSEPVGFIKDTDVVLPYQKVVLLALRHYAKTKLDFVDCILAGYAEAEKAKSIHSTRICKNSSTDKPPQNNSYANKEALVIID